MSKKKYNTKLIKNIISGLFALFLLFWLFQIDWNHISNKENSGAIFGVLAGLLIIISLQIKTKESKK
ncbi:hypothetical protein MC378_02740 [Polaribacter sp. MSW13]|uniref:Uncharacterized protein n=1 Tax=Polaribacter marinus TaxID=2916838 RepID=A0A9X1VP62_9FLAO|nr:hypothetical protein [Polaribacter marinus]MCI2228070.1 hypothetical protein [Polaribacter marinus]